MQSLINKNIKNLDAAYKLIAYRIAREYDPDRDDAKPPSAFVYWYEEQLKRDIFVNPRPVNEDDYEPKMK